MVGGTRLSLFLHRCAHFVLYPLGHIVLWFLLGVSLLIIGCIHIFPWVSIGIIFKCHSKGTTHPFWRFFYEIDFVLLWCTLFLYWNWLENWWGCLLPQVLPGGISTFGVCNLKIGHRWLLLSRMLVFCNVPGKIWWRPHWPCLLPLVPDVPTHR